MSLETTNDIRLTIQTDGRILREDVKTVDVTEHVYDKLRQKAQARGLLIPGTLGGSFFYMEMHAEPMRLFCLRLLPGIKFKTFWRSEVNEGDILFRPCFQNSPESMKINPDLDSENQEFVWVPPKDMALVLIANAQLTRGTVTTETSSRDDWRVCPYSPAKVHLKGSLGMAAIDRTSVRIGYPPFPNTHSGGSLCSGFVMAKDERLPSPEKLVEKISFAYNENEWNLDLFTTGLRSQFEQWVKFDKEGKQIPLKEGEWQDGLFHSGFNFSMTTGANFALEALHQQYLQPVHAEHVEGQSNEEITLETAEGGTENVNPAVS